MGNPEMSHEEPSVVPEKYQKDWAEYVSKYGPQSDEAMRATIKIWEDIDFDRKFEKDLKRHQDSEADEQWAATAAEFYEDKLDRGEHAMPEDIADIGVNKDA